MQRKVVEATGSTRLRDAPAQRWRCRTDAPIAPAYAYRFDYKGQCVLLTGDLKFHAPLVASARGVDILVSELPSPDGMLARRVFAQGLGDVRRGDWTIADDGSLCTLPLDRPTCGAAVWSSNNR